MIPETRTFCVKRIPHPVKMAEGKKFLLNYQLEEVVGYGSWGKVKRALDTTAQSPPSHQVAIKILRKRRISRKIRDGINKIYREFELLKGLNHEGIVKYYDLIETDYLDDEGSESTCSSAPSSPSKSSTSSTTSSSLASYSSAGMKDGKIYLVMEWLGDGCNLTHWIQQEKNPRRRNIKGILKTLLETIQYLQEHEITHHDIKLDNVIYDFLTGSVKIIDFGVSEHCPRDESYSAFGTPAYQAPELFTKPSPCDEKYFVSGHKLDVWAVGVVAYQLANEEGALPFDGDSLMEIFDTIIHRDPNWHLLKQNSNNTDLKNLISKLLNKNPNERLSAKEALNHAYFKSSSTDNNQPFIKNIIKSIFNRLVK